MSEADPIALCVAARISPEVALARLVLAGVSPGQIAQQLAACRRGSEAAGERTASLARLLAERRECLYRLAGMLAASGLDHATLETDAADALARTRAAFDRAVAWSPEASVAAYSLGDPAILAAATAELVAWLTAEDLVGPDRDMLDFGCGIGRVAAAVAPLCRSVLGLDLSPGMIAEARRRHARPNLRFAVTSGYGLSVLEQAQPDGNEPGRDGMEGLVESSPNDFALREASFDLVLAVDSFPYLIQAAQGVAERHVADAARLLRPRNGALVILNLSYRGDLAADRADAERWASSYGFRLIRNGNAPFTLWDGTAFVLRNVNRRTGKPA